MSRTTIDLDPVVLHQLKERQRREKKTLGQLTSELLSRALEEEDTTTPPFQWTSADLDPFVDLDNKEAVAAALGDDSPR